jgi:hypothetical protein
MKYPNTKSQAEAICCRQQTTALQLAEMENKRRELPRSHALAFAMGLQARLGAASAVLCLAVEEGILKMIFDFIGSLEEMTVVVLMSSSISNEVDKVHQRKVATSQKERESARAHTHTHTHTRFTRKLSYAHTHLRRSRRHWQPRRCDSSR